ncbi:hypothetical protein GCM10009030_15830 [Haloarcula pellucida]|uniref:Uncharacterized protein n=1 Tax=Haloarcula pellucida TaxID=1427151 RepID=A0A830GLH8_9EURY|nr:hypothetical protein GCM10009030_15830 [Halomicroarcula pellucida]
MQEAGDGDPHRQRRRVDGEPRRLEAAGDEDRAQSEDDRHQRVHYRGAVPAVNGDDEQEREHAEEDSQYSVRFPYHRYEPLLPEFVTRPA